MPVGSTTSKPGLASTIEEGLSPTPVVDIFSSLGLDEWFLSSLSRFRQYTNRL